MFSKTVFCDLDGVLADFDTGVFQITGKYPDELKYTSQLWSAINRSNCFYDTLPWLPSGQKLWSQLLVFSKPIILTGTYTKKAEIQKRLWCEKELGADINVICCKTKDKPLYCAPGSILIDDRTVIQEEWEKKGGIFLHFTGTEDNIQFILEFLQKVK